MLSLRRSSLYWLTFLPFLIGCSTSHYRVVPWRGLKNELVFTPDRVLLECEYISDYSGDIQNPYGFMIHVLDEKDTVLTASQGSVLDKDDCLEQVAEIGKILKKGRTISIGGMGDLNEPRSIEKRTYRFPGLGTFRSNGRTIQFMMIWNEFNQCYDSQYGKGNPCPRSDFAHK
ncbi:MAG: hypothetical protein IPJ84_17070 [Bdellovibrionales bacterium]|nr:hypothetical protein [Bdellovibrionales bacterium]